MKCPSNPPSPFMLFLEDVRSSVEAQHDDLAPGEIGRIIGKMWADLSASDKKPYETTYAAMAQYRLEKAAYQDWLDSKEWDDDDLDLGAKQDRAIDRAIDASIARICFGP